MGSPVACGDELLVAYPEEVARFLEEVMVAESSSASCKQQGPKAATLEKIVGTREQPAALLASNKATFDTANLSASFDNPVPVTKVEVQPASGDMDSLGGGPPKSRAPRTG